MRATRRYSSLASATALTYTLKRSLYVPLTCRCNTVTLPETRGPGFVLPPQVVASLLRIRDAELGNDTAKWSHWCMWLDTQEAPQQLPPPSVEQYVSQLRSTGNNDDKSSTRLTAIVDALKEEIDQVLSTNSNKPEPLVFAGEGEPTLCLEELCDLSRTFFSRVPTIRVTTNGLIVEQDTAQRLKDSGVTAISIALMTANPNQYHQLMKPMLLKHDSSSTCEQTTDAHFIVCEFIQQALRCNLKVEVTGVDRPDVDKGATQQLASSLGVSNPIRWRPYFD